MIRCQNFKLKQVLSMFLAVVLMAGVAYVDVAPIQAASNGKWVLASEKAYIPNKYSVETFGGARVDKGEFSWDEYTSSITLKASGGVTFTNEGDKGKLLADWYYNCSRPAASYSEGQKVTLAMHLYTKNSTAVHEKQSCSSLIAEPDRNTGNTYTGYCALTGDDGNAYLEEPTNSTGTQVDNNSSVKKTVYADMPTHSLAGDYVSVYFSTGWYTIDGSDTSTRLSYEWKYKYVSNAALKSVKTKTSSVAYTGKARKPAVIVKDTNGNTVSSSNYTVSYSNNKKVGKATVTVKGKGSYSGTVKTTFKIVPKKTTISKAVKKKSGVMVVKWKKNTSGSGYQLIYSTNKKFASSKSKKTKISKNKIVSKTIKSLKSGKTYYVKVRAYKKVSGVTYYGAWSKTKVVKV